ncbi:hypothetical protein CIPAW_15G027400 [Carya illinoinensis]|uniref:Protein kinase domain-containing protein n=1 Tax=Carya illinoinensis TaxID=32201 RepID=A0A8T1N790_CARIL|nr:hypothetical protein CIPAW_15G027400 [Carya illinoinensis]KAG6674137.1 hypothetical protein I3842_15G027300 [Carya illinoinensis]
MAFNGKLLQPLLALGVLIVLILVASAASKPNSLCKRRCGLVEIPYPFGTSDGCYLDSTFLITCNSTFNPPKPSLGPDMFVENISVPDGELRVSNPVANLCKSFNHNNKPTSLPTQKAGTKQAFSINYSGNSALFKLSNFRISNNRNKITAVGCGVYSYIRGFVEQEGFTTGCLSLCNDNANDVVNGSCSGIGCLDEKAYNFSSSDFQDLENRTTVPLVLDWAVGNETCKEAEKNNDSYACKAPHSYCYNSRNGPGYRCNCSNGYQGNPYLPDSCQGDGRKDGTDCRPIVLGQSNNKIISIALGVSISLLVLLVGTSWVYWGLKKRKLVKLKEKWFKQNGGLMLQQRLQNCTGSMDTTKIYSVEELKKATDNYDKSKILGQGGYGTVYKGVLPNNKVVAIKKSKISDQSQIEQFINEVIVVTQINHRNVVKLLGCCLETEVPLLVYEFITNGTLYDYIHDKNRSFLLSWDKRLKIATETAGALAYLHCEASMSIIHRDVKTANILLDDNHTAKVSDFGASRLIPLDRAHLTTLVQGTHGYLDPEYYRTSHLTEKSDVYSFGAVLAELLTGKKVICFLRPESERNLATYFVSMVEQDRLLEILDDHIYYGSNAEELKKVADVVKRSLSVKGDDRPTMKEVAVELDGLRIKER